ncbi:Carbamoyl phosphate synthase large subunit [Tsukamurella ocularis]|uniref:ATP-grasp domain-containing protein n=1 Tax=Tsukamurella ocularis TaxID=1970234 RepID=UPI0039EEBF52
MVMNIFVPGLTRPQREELRTVDVGSEIGIHALLDVDSVTVAEHLDFQSLLRRARAELDAFDGTVDAVVPHWDFPTSVLAPMLAAEHSLPSPSLESVLSFEHKYWSRLIQRRAIPEHVPRFAAFDPFDPEVERSGVGLPFPFWVKPVKSHSSQLGFEVRDAAGLRDALEVIRKEIRTVGDAFDEVLSMVDVPEGVRGVTGTSCIAEEVIAGTQAAPEVSMFQGELVVHGFFDMRRSEDGHSFDSLCYPARTVPPAVRDRMVVATERVLREAGFDNGCANAEFMWDDRTDRLSMIEVNTRISQSHSDLFVKVDGTSNHEYAIAVALGRRPRPGARAGRFGAAAKHLIGVHTDGVVRAVPTDRDLARLREEFPETVVQLAVKPGDRLSELPNQDPYRYVLATVYLGAEAYADLADVAARVEDHLPFRIENDEASLDRRPA